MMLTSRMHISTGFPQPVQPTPAPTKDALVIQT